MLTIIASNSNKFTFYGWSQLSMLKSDTDVY